MLTVSNWALGFQFNRFFTIPKKKTFLVLNKANDKIGTGKVIDLNASHLLVKLKVQQGALEVNAVVDLKYLKSDSYSHYMTFSYKDDLGLSNSRIEETVKADSYMASRGVLTFFYNNQKNYFQLKKVKEKTQSVFNWGTVFLQVK